MRDSDNLKGLEIEKVDTVKIKDECPKCETEWGLAGEKVGRRVLISCSECDYDTGVDFFNELEEEFDYFELYMEDENPDLGFD